MRIFASLLIGLLFLHQPTSTLATDATTPLIPSDESPTPPSALYPQTAEDCTAEQIWDRTLVLCLPAANKTGRRNFLAISGNAFGGYATSQGPRGPATAFSPNRLQTDFGRRLGADHYLNLSIVGSGERWTLPPSGMPQVGQLGPPMANGGRYLDARAPLNTPIAGLTLSDTMLLGNPQVLRLTVFFAPRGEATEGPVSYLRRPTAVINPDAPLAYELGQGVGQIASTVLGAALTLGATQIEASVFHGAEPSPATTGLPLARPDSVALRVAQQFSTRAMALASLAYAQRPGAGALDIPYELRFSASIYRRFFFTNALAIDSAFIYSGVMHYDHVSWLNAFGEELVLRFGDAHLWVREEILQRTANELDLPNATDGSAPHWISASTLGYTQYLATIADTTVGLGIAVTKTWLPESFTPAYGGGPWGGKVWIQLKGLQRWEW